MSAETLIVYVEHFLLSFHRAGGVIVDELSVDLVRVPPLSVLLRQNIVEKRVKEGDSERTKSELESELFAVSAKASIEVLELVCFDVWTSMKSAHSPPMRIKYESINQLEGKEESAEMDVTRPAAKRAKTTSHSLCNHLLSEAARCAQWIDAILVLQ